MNDFRSLSMLREITKFFYLLSKSYPNFIAYNYLRLVSAIPSESYLQIRNIILATIPLEQQVQFENTKVDDLMEGEKTTKRVVLFDTKSILQDMKFNINLGELEKNKKEILNFIEDFGGNKLLLIHSIILSILDEKIKEKIPRR